MPSLAALYVSRGKGGLANASPRSVSPSDQDLVCARPNCGSTYGVRRCIFRYQTGKVESRFSFVERTPLCLNCEYSLPWPSCLLTRRPPALAQVAPQGALRWPPRLIFLDHLLAAG